VLYNYNLIL